MLWMTLMSAAAMQPAAVAAPDSVIVDLVAGEGKQHCLPDRRLCFELAAAEGGGDLPGNLLVSSPSSGDAEKITLSLPAGFGDGRTLELWPKLIPVPRASDDGARTGVEYLVGVIVKESTMYSGGGGSGGRLHLLRFGMAPHATALGGEVLDIVWDSSLSIRACFSEQDMKDRRGVCHDEYEFTGSLTAAANDGGELPSLTYRSVATAYPQTSRRSEDNSGQKLKASDLNPWRDTECSYVRVLRYNPATSRYEMDRPAPDCSSYTTP